ncbi:MAG: protocatechuate 3,4-dioxygenase subunit alpha [Rhodobacteraceae bacterium]|nr:protocatechuate 3,4-dioxygenase subunit alpha [Paracoccaceae bacterium]
MALSPKIYQELPSQTAGPYVHIGCTPQMAGLETIYGGGHLGSKMVNDKTLGIRISISGKIFDGTGTPIKDGIIELWQADAQGLFNSPAENRGKSDLNFKGWGRQPTDILTGEFHFDTIKPGRIPYLSSNKLQAPFISIWVAARGINLGLHTRMYFPEEVEANTEDPVLNRLEHQNRVHTLIAKPLEDGMYQFDIVLQGKNETVFFDI